MKLEIAWRTLFSRGLSRKVPQQASIVIFSGRQGSGKSYGATRLALMSSRDIVANYHIKELPENLGNLGTRGKQRSIEYRTTDEILKSDHPGKLVIIDELYSLINRHDRLSRDFMSWIAQARKNDRATILIAQQLSEVPVSIRRFSSDLVSCRSFLRLTLETWHRGDSLVWDDEVQDWVASPWKFSIYRRIPRVAECYDTLERVPLAGSGAVAASGRR